jgi:phage terminase large subunit
MSPETCLQEIAAEFTAFVGKIYPDFSDKTHVKQFEYNPMWKNYIAFDFGYVNPLAAIEFMVDPWDNIWIWREHYKSKMTNEQHIRALIARPNPPGYHLDLAFGDAADPEAVEYISQHYYPCIADPLSKSNWRDGVDLVNQFVRLQVVGVDDDTGDLIEEPKLFVHPNCPETIREFNNYKSPSPTRGKNPRAAREMGLAIDDHAMDAIRYGIMHIFKLGLHGNLGEANVKATHTFNSEGESPLLSVSKSENSPLYIAAERSGSTFVNMNMEF